MQPVTAESRAQGPFRLTDEQQMLRDAVRVLADERVAPRAADIDRTGEFPEDIRQLLADHDILALPFPTEYGGLGGELLTRLPRRSSSSAAPARRPAILAVQELGRCRSPRRHPRAEGALAPEARQRASTSSRSP